MKALWFSRHNPTPEQLAAIMAMGYELTPEDIKDGMEWGAKDCSTVEQALEIRQWIGSKEQVKKLIGVRVFGVFPVELRWLAFDTIEAHADGINMPGEVSVGLMESVNDSRSVEGGKPTFKFLKWRQTGVL